jgi:Protein of unknown function (DUF2635)
MDSLTLKPAVGRIVKDPDTLQPLAESGETKPADLYWQRRLLDGDVLQVDTMTDAQNTIPEDTNLEP